MRTHSFWVNAVRSLLGGCIALSCSPATHVSDQTQAPKVVPADGKGEPTAPVVGVVSGVPLETAPPNVPEFKPAFAGQTRASAIHTQTPIEVTQIAGEFDEPWAIAFLPDRRMLVTTKHEGKLYVVSTDGKKSEPTQGVPRVDGR